MTDRYSKNTGALSEKEIEILQSKKVCIVGCGGLGGYAVELLARVGVGTIRVVDGDVFDETNLNRQLLCEESNIGLSKAQAARKRINAINSTVRVEIISTHMTEENAGSIVSGCDAVIDCLDSIESRKLLAGVCAEEQIYLVHGAVGGWCAQVSVISPGCDIFDIIYPEGSTSKMENTLSFVASFAASVQVAETVKLLTGRPPTLKNRLFICDLLTGTEEILDLTI